MCNRRNRQVKMHRLFLNSSLVDYYTIGELTWRIHVIGIIVAVIIYCISLIFSYGCDLQRESDETL